MKEVFKYGIRLLTYILFLVGLVSILNHPLKCSFSKNVVVSKAEVYNNATDEYIYEIEECSTNTDDLFQLVDISGWLLKKEKDDYQAVFPDVFLYGKTESYYV